MPPNARASLAESWQRWAPSIEAEPAADLRRAARRLAAPRLARSADVRDAARRPAHSARGAVRSGDRSCSESARARGHGDLVVCIAYPDDLRGSFTVTLSRGSPRAHARAARRARGHAPGRVSTRTEHYLVARETQYRGLAPGRYWITVDGDLFAGSGDEPIEQPFESQPVHVRSRDTHRLEFDLRPRSCPVEVRTIWEGQTVRECAIARARPARHAAPHARPVGAHRPADRAPRDRGRLRRPRRGARGRWSTTTRRRWSKWTSASPTACCSRAARRRSRRTCRATCRPRRARSRARARTRSRTSCSRGCTSSRATRRARPSTSSTRATSATRRACARSSRSGRAPRRCTRRPATPCARPRCTSARATWSAPARPTRSAADLDRALGCYREARDTERVIGVLERRGETFEAAQLARESRRPQPRDQAPAAGPARRPELHRSVSDAGRRARDRGPRRPGRAQAPRAARARRRGERVAGAARASVRALGAQRRSRARARVVGEAAHRGADLAGALVAHRERCASGCPRRTRRAAAARRCRAR